MPFAPDGPFRGSTALASGAISRWALRSSRYRRLFPDIYAPAELEIDLALRARAAGLLVAGCGVVAGYAAAELLGASSGPRDGPVEVLCAQNRRWVGVCLRRGRPEPDETQAMGGFSVTTPARTAFDLARWAPSLTEGVVAVDALVHTCQVTTAEVVALRSRHLGVRHGGRIAPVVELVDARSESCMESRIRVALVLAGLPPEVQHQVEIRGRRFRLDLAYPAARIAVEYDGEDHRSQRRARRDLAREAALTAAGWTILRFDADVVLFAPWRIVAAVRAELAA